MEDLGGREDSHVLSMRRGPESDIGIDKVKFAAPPNDVCWQQELHVMVRECGIGGVRSSFVRRMRLCLKRVKGPIVAFILRKSSSRLPVTKRSLQHPKGSRTGCIDLHLIRALSYRQI
jgi:hypothetical protein